MSFLNDVRLHNAFTMEALMRNLIIGLLLASAVLTTSLSLLLLDVNFFARRYLILAIVIAATCIMSFTTCMGIYYRLVRTSQATITPRLHVVPQSLQQDQHPHDPANHHIHINMYFCRVFVPHTMECEVDNLDDICIGVAHENNNNNMVIIQNPHD